MPLTRVVISIFFALTLLGNDSAAQVNEHVHEIGEKALVLIKESVDQKDQYRLLSDAAVMFARNREQEFAHELLQEALATVRDHPRRSYVALRLSQSGFFDEAVAIAKELSDLGNGITRDSCLSMIVWQMCEKGEIEAAAAIVEQFSDTWQASALASLANASHRLGHADAANVLVDRAFDSAMKLATDKLKADAVSSLVHALVGEMPIEARAIIDRYAQASNNPKNMVTVLTLLAICGDVDRVRRVGEDYRKIADQDQDVVDAQLQNLLAWAQVRSGAVDEAMATLGIRENSDVEWYIAEEIVNALLKAHRPDDALKTLETIVIEDDSEDTLPVLLLIATAFSELGNNQKAEELLVRCKHIADSLEPFRIPDWSFDIARTHSQMGLESECEKWIDTLKWPAVKADALVGLANGILDREKASK